jgi:hypothetical protein
LAVEGDAIVTGTSTLATTAISTLNLGTALSAVNGGTGLSSVTQNQLLIGGAGNTWTQVATSSLGLGNGTFLGLTDTPSSYTANRILYQTGAAVTDSANFTFDGSQLSVNGDIRTGYIVATSTTGTSTFAGRVGIGTSTPAALLSVIDGSIYSGSAPDVLYVKGAQAFGNAGGVNLIGGDGDVGSGGGINLFGGLGDVGGAINIVSGTGTGASGGDITIMSGGGSGLAAGGSLFLTSGKGVFSDGNVNINATGTGMIRLGNLAGNVAIGTSTASQKLTVSGNLRLTGAIFDGANASGTEGMVLQSTGTSTRWVATSSLGISGVTTLAGLSDTNISGPATGELLSYDGADWVNVATSTLAIALGDTTGILAATRGGTGLSSVTQNQLLIGGAGNTWTQVATSSLGLGNGTFLGLSDTQSSYTANRILFTNSGASAVTDSADFVFTGTNFGIGSTTPSARLTIVGAAGSANTFTIASSTGNTTLAMLSNGNLELPGQLISAGIEWTARSAADNNDSWRSVVYGDGRFVALADVGDRVMYSPNGIDWATTSAAGNNDSWQGVAYGNGLFVAVGTTGDRVMTSPDGINWTVRSAADDNDSWYGVTYGDGLFVAVGGGTDRVMTSPDGINWTVRSAAGDNDQWRSVTYGNGLFVVVGTTGGSDKVMTSPDGINWTVRSAAGNDDFWSSVTYGNGLFVAVGNAGDRVMTSGKQTINRLATNNIYQGGTSFMGGLQAGTTTASALASIFLQSEAGKNPFAIASSTGEQLITLTQTGALGVGSSTPTSMLSVVGSLNGNTDQGISRVLSVIGGDDIGTGQGILLKAGNGSAWGGSIDIIAGSQNQTGAGGGSVNITAGDGSMDQNGGSVTITAGNTAGAFGSVSGDISLITKAAAGVYGKILLAPNGGNVGLGTTTPGSKLTVAGDIFATGAFRDSSNASGTAGMVLQSTGAGTQWVATSSLGISGVTTLAGLSDTNISGPADGELLSYISGEWVNVATSTLGLGNGTFLGLTDTPSSYTANRILYQTGAAVTDSANFTFDGSQLSVNGDVRSGYFTATSTTGTSTFAGAVGIGTTTPGNTLTVEGSAAFTGNVGIGTSPSYGFHVNKSTIYLANGSTPILYYGATGLSLLTSSAAAVNTVAIGAGNGLSVGSTSGAPTNGIYAVGSIGVGTSTPAAKLTVVGDAGSNDILRLASSTGSTLMSLTATGRLGLGTTTPTALLSLMGTSGQTNSLFTISSSTGATLFNVLADGSLDIDAGGIYYDASTRQTSIESLNLGAINFADDAGAVSWVDMAVTSAAATGTVMSYTAQLDANPLLTIYGESAGSGNVQNLRVAVGSTTPSARLTVVGANGTDNLFTFASSTGSSLLSLTSGGRLVFGSTMNADIFINGGTSTTSPQLNGDNVVIGNQAFQYASSTSLAQYNIALGTQALFGSSTVPMTGGYNFAAGLQALQFNTSGEYNIGIGYRALRDNTTGSNNIAIGEASLADNTTGSLNIGLGQYSLTGNTTGQSNIAFGYEALTFNVTGSSNIAVGEQAMSYNESGSGNIALGNGSLINIYTGSYNNSFGHRSLYNYNGTGTIGIGYQAGDALTNGDRNIIIGYDVDFDNASTSLGLNIGNLIYGTNVDGTGTTKSTGNIGIGTSTPSSKLTVAGDINLTGALRANGDAGTTGYILQTTGTGVQWVATSSLGISGGASTFLGLADTPSSYTANRILFTNSGASAVTDSADFVFTGTNFGLGSTTPSARLTVQGAAGAANIATFASSTGSTTLALLANGNLELPGQLISAGINWTAQSATEANSWNSVTYGNGLFVAVSGDGTNRVMTSPDGINWSTSTAAEANTWRSITYGNGLFVAVSSDGTNRVMTSPDGITWTARSAAEANSWSSVTYGEGLFVAVAETGTNRVMTSPDGIVWTARSVVGYSWEAVAYGNGRFVAVSDFDDAMYSLDGISWTTAPVSSYTTRTSITYGNGLFVSVGDFADAMYSSDGINWVDGGYLNGLYRSVTYGNGLFVAVSADGIQTSPDAINWTYRGNPSTGIWRSVIYGNGRFVTVSSSGTNRVMISGFTETSALAHNNIYQGGTSFMGGLRVGTTSTSVAADIFLQGRSGINPFAIASSTGAQLLTLTQTGALGLGTSTPFGAGLTIERTGLSGTTTAGIGQYLTFSNSVAAAQQFGNNTYISASNTATTTLLGSFLRIQDNSVLGNTVRGFEVQADLGANTAGENTAISAYARTLGVRGYTSGDAGATIEPAGVYGETGGTTQGNAIRGYSSTITTAALLKLFQDSSTFTGTGLLMNFGNAGGSFSSTTASRFIDLKNAGTSMFTVGAYGMLTIGDGSTTTNAGIQIGYGGICVDNDGSCTASTTGRITAVEYGTNNSDLAENYFTSEDLEPGEVVYLKGGLSVGRATKAESGKVIGVVSTAPGIIMGDNDSSLTQGERAVPIGLAGRVPVRISDENGEVEVGDELMLSSIPGVVMKASSTGQVVGRALEAFDATRAYSATYINQFGENIIVPEYTPINRESDPRIDDGCYYGGGNRTGEEPCVPLLATSTEAQYDEADRLAAEEAKAAALAALALVPSEEVALTAEETVQVGQIVMFIDPGFRYLDEAGMAMVAALMATTTEEVEGEKVEGTLWQRLVTLAQNFVDGVLTVTGLRTDRIETKELCVDGVCLNADDIRTLLNESAPADHSVSSDGGVVPEPEPEPEVVPEPIPVPAPDPELTQPEAASTTEPVVEEATSTETMIEEESEVAEEEVAEEVFEEVTPEPTPESASQPEPIPEPEPILNSEPPSEEAV